MLPECFALSVTLISNGIKPIESNFNTVLKRLKAFIPAGTLMVSFAAIGDSTSGFPLNVASFTSTSSYATPRISYSLPNTLATAVLSLVFSKTIPGFVVSGGAKAIFQLFNLPLLVLVRSVSSFKNAAYVVRPSCSIIVLTEESVERS